MEKLLAFIVAAIIALTAHLYSANYLGNKFDLQEFYDSAKTYFSSSKNKSGKKTGNTGNSVRQTRTTNHK